MEGIKGPERQCGSGVDTDIGGPRVQGLTHLLALLPRQPREAIKAPVTLERHAIDDLTLTCSPAPKSPHLWAVTYLGSCFPRQASGSVCSSSALAGKGGGMTEKPLLVFEREKGRTRGLEYTEHTRNLPTGQCLIWGS